MVISTECKDNFTDCKSKNIEFNANKCVNHLLICPYSNKIITWYKKMLFEVVGHIRIPVLNSIVAYKTM